MAAFQAINVGLSFLLEIAMLAAFAWWGYHAVDNPWLRWVLAILAPLVAAALWGLFLAPRAGRRVDSSAGIPISLVLFLLAALALFATKLPALGAAMLVLAVVNRILMILWKQW